MPTLSSVLQCMAFMHPWHRGNEHTRYLHVGHSGLSDDVPNNALISPMIFLTHVFVTVAAITQRYATSVGKYLAASFTNAESSYQHILLQRVVFLQECVEHYPVVVIPASERWLTHKVERAIAGHVVIRTDEPLFTVRRHRI